MPFVVQCPYCKVRARVPDRALGASGKCSRCHNAFTLVPADDQCVPELVGAPTDSSSSDLEPQTEPAVGTGLPEVDPEADAAAAAEILRSAQEFEDEAETDEAEKAPVEDLLQPSVPSAVPKRARVRSENIAGAAALFLGGAALCCASFRLSAPFVWPMSAVGVLLGLFALAFARRARKKQRRLLLPIGGAVVSLAVLTLAWFFPALLGPTYAFSRQASAPAVAALRAVPLKGAPLAGISPEWVDAGRFALQRGDVRVQIVSVALGPPPGADEKQKPPPKDVLLVRVRVQRTQLMEVKDREISSFEWTDKRRPTLVDAGGRSYELRDVRVVGSADATHIASLFPVSVVNEDLVFAPAVAGMESLKLELPGVSALGGGAFRFTLPAAMIASAKQPPKDAK